jgi:hypothetical protein
MRLVEDAALITRNDETKNNLLNSSFRRTNPHLVGMLGLGRLGSKEH